MLVKILYFFAIVCVFSASQPVDAALFRWTFTANVEQTAGNDDIATQVANFGFETGTQIAGTINFTTDAIDFDPTPDGGFYIGAVLNAMFMTDDVTLAMNQPSSLSRLAVDNGPQDTLDADGNVNSTPIDFMSTAFILRLVDDTGTALNSDQIPTSGYDLSDFNSYDGDLGFPETTGLFLIFSDGVNSAFLDASLQTFSVTPVPLGSTVLFLFSSLGVLSQIRKRQ